MHWTVGGTSKHAFILALYRTQNVAFLAKWTSFSFNALTSELPNTIMFHSYWHETVIAYPTHAYYHVSSALLRGNQCAWSYVKDINIVVIVKSASYQVFLWNSDSRNSLFDSLVSLYGFSTFWVPLMNGRLGSHFSSEHAASVWAPRRADDVISVGIKEALFSGRRVDVHDDA